MENKDFLYFRINEVNEFYNRSIEEIRRLDSVTMKKILILSMIDSLAQEYSNYGKNNQGNFINFLNTFSNYNYWNKIDVVTLYYSEKEIFEKNNIKMNFIRSSRMFKVSEIVELAKNKGIEKFIQDTIDIKTIDKHRYANLLFKYSSKLVHEFAPPTAQPKLNENDDEPVYLKMVELKLNEETNTTYIDDYGSELCFTYKFLENIFVETLDNYLKYCIKNEIDPFKNKKNYRTWYE